MIITNSGRAWFLDVQHQLIQSDYPHSSRQGRSSLLKQTELYTYNNRITTQTIQYTNNINTISNINR